MNRRRIVTMALAVVAAVAWLGSFAGAEALARRVVAPGAPGQGGMINLPHMVNDNAGNQWRIYQGGWLQQTGNMPLYSQGAMLTINGAQPNVGQNMARLDPESGEVVFENLTGNGVSVTRRILVDRDKNWVRYIDVIRNTAGREQTVNVQLTSNFNYGLQGGRGVSDPRRKGQDVGWVGQTHANGMAVVEVYAGKGTKMAPTVNGQPQNNNVMAVLQVPLKPGKEAAILHLHASAPNLEAGVKLVEGVKEKDLLKEVPREIRRLIVNVARSEGFVGEIDVLRGDMLDVVELKTGDQFKGTLKETGFALETFYGPVQLPTDRVVGLMNVGRFRPRQLLITADGQIFGGNLKKQTIDLQLTSGQVTQIPLAQVSRVGYRKRDGEKEQEEWTYDKPVVVMRSGERVGVKMPAAPLEVVTRYGRVSLKPESVAAVVLVSEEHGAHEVHLTDGSRFTGLLNAEQFDMVLEAAGVGGAEQTVKFQTSGISRMQLAGKVAEQDEATPTLELTNDDVLVGTLQGKIELATAFDTISVNASEVKTLTHPPQTVSDVTVTLWDGTSLSGQLQDQGLNVALLSGAKLKVPVANVVKYEQPQPQPSATMVEKIKEFVAELNADDWKKRDRAQAQLVQMGQAAATVLKQVRDAQPPEAQQRIDAILKELEAQKSARPAAATAPAVNVPELPALIDN